MRLAHEGEHLRIRPGSDRRGGRSFTRSVLRDLDGRDCKGDRFGFWDTRRDGRRWLRFWCGGLGFDTSFGIRIHFFSGCDGFLTPFIQFAFDALYRLALLIAEKEDRAGGFHRARPEHQSDLFTVRKQLLEEGGVHIAQHGGAAGFEQYQPITPGTPAPAISSRARSFSSALRRNPGPLAWEQ
jgi:hypothetical protein